jgi:hypothetical protein
MKFPIWVLLACFSLSGALPILSKGSIDLVALKKQEEERRKKISKSKQAVNDTNVSTIVIVGKSYGFVQMEPDAPPAEDSIPEIAKGAAEVNTPEIAKGVNDTPLDKQPDFWKKQQVELESQIAQLKEGINGEQNDLNRLWSDFYIKNIPAEQDAIKVQITQMTNQIEQKKLFLAQFEAQLVDLYEKARKAGIPPGWLR